MNSTKTTWKAKGALLLSSTLLALVCAEGAFRTHLIFVRKTASRELNYEATAGVFVKFNEKWGAEPKPNSTFWIYRVRDGRLVWCKLRSRSNRDGLYGKTTIEDYDRAKTKILVFGDSFTQFLEDGVTWPDLLEQDLRQRTREEVSVLNYGREGCGVMQMLDLAVDKVDELHPDCVIVGAIYDDFTRARTWHKEIESGGRTRWMVSSRNDEFLDYRFAADHIVVEPAATREWCERSSASAGAADPILERMNLTYRELKREADMVVRPFHPFAINCSYLYNRLSTGSAFGHRLQDIPRIDFDDYQKDERTLRDLQRLKNSGVRIVLAYLPLAAELQSQSCHLDGQSQRLMNSLERLADHHFWLIQEHYSGPTPGKIDLLPEDGHPNRTGLELYAGTIADLIIGELKIKACTAALTSSVAH